MEKPRPSSEFLHSLVNTESGVVWVLVRVFLGPWSGFPPTRSGTNMPSSYATYPLSQASDRTKNRLAFAVKLRESFEAYLSDKDDWPTSYYSELLLDTPLEDLTPTEVKDLDVWYGKHWGRGRRMSIEKLNTKLLFSNLPVTPGKPQAKIPGYPAKKFFPSFGRERNNQPKVFLHKVFPNPGCPGPNPGTSRPLRL